MSADKRSLVRPTRCVVSPPCDLRDERAVLSAAEKSAVPAARAEVCTTSRFANCARLRGVGTNTQRANSIANDRPCRKCYNHKLSHPADFHRGRVAQLAEQLTLNQ